ncbi:unnamed protein product [Sympodiomycopsis kandeliae]
MASGKPPPSSLDSIVSSLVKSTSHLNDEELDKYIADLILKEAQGSSDAGASSSRAPQPSRAASTNKQFLASTIRSVDGHNRHVIRAQLQEARRGQRERRNGQGSTQTSPNLDSPPRRNAMRGWDSPERSKQSTKSRSSFATTQNVHSTSARTSQRSVSPPPPMESKMDKYFASDYDPTLDIQPEHSTDATTGLIADGGWDTMLDNIKAGFSSNQDSHHSRDERRARHKEQSRSRDTSRRHDDHRKSKHRRPRDDASDTDESRGSSRKNEKSSSRHRRHRDDDSDTDRRSSKKGSSSSRDHERRHRHDRRHEERGSRRHESSRRRRSRSPSSFLSRRKKHRANSPDTDAPKIGTSAMDTKYSKQGSTREWDLGKGQRPDLSF